VTDTNVRIGGLTFWGGEGSDGFYIRKGGLKGFLDGVGVRGNSVERPMAHGDFDLPVFRSARTVSISGPCLAPSEGEWMHRNRQLTGLFGDGRSGRVTFDVGGTVLWGDARLGDTPQWEPQMWGSRADYLLVLRFADPRLFGETRTFAGGVAAYHYGNFAASPVHTVSGVGSGYTINGPGGKTFTVTEAVTSEVPHRIDMATGFLEVGGVVVVGQVTSADVWAVPGGGTVTHTLTGSGLTLSTAVADTYI